MTIIVTGVSGFIGAAVAEAFLHAGHRVIGTTRSRASRVPAGPNFSEFQVDLANPEAARNLIEAGRSHDNGLAIVHIAGLASDWGPEELYYRANVLAVENLLSALGDFQSPADKPGTAPLFIHTSSISVHGFSINHQNTNEDGPYSKLVTPYQRSKLQSEQLIREAADSGLRCLVLRPGNVYGPEDSTTLYPLLDAIRSGSMAYIRQGRHLTCPIAIDDMVQAYTKAFDRLRSDKWATVAGKSFNITTGERISWRQFLETAADKAQLPAPRFSYPAWLGYLGAGALTGLFLLLRKKSAPPLTRYRIQQVAHDYHFSIARAQELLGFSPRIGLEDGLALACAAWRSDRGLDEHA